MTAGSRAPTVLVVVNDPDSGPGRVGDRLAERGLRLVTVTGDDVPEHPAGHEGVLLLGGGFMPDADERAPWLPRERRLAEAALSGGVPLLGVCLGGQLLALVAGGVVAADHGRPERGLVTIRRRPESAGDPLLGSLPPAFPALENHRDAVTALPPGAAHLAESGDCPVQAFRVGEQAWGLQFHPEAGAARMRRWDPERVAGDGYDLPALLAAAERDEPAAASAARALTDAFAAVVHRHAGRG
jgi:GMP synthase-like glutamine amidotransferase